MDFVIYGGVLLVSFLVCYLLEPYVIKFAVKKNIIDVPKDNRRVHKKPVPRVGGIAMVVGMAVSILGIYIVSLFYDKIKLDTRLIGYVLGAAVIAVMGFVDDVYNLRARYKFVFQMIAATIVYIFGISIVALKIPFIYPQTIDFGIFAFPITVIWMLAITNAVNLIDGLDGLAAGISSISAVSLLFIFVTTGAPVEAIIVVLALVGVTLGFLPYNFNPARTFMGDVGANFLGFTLATVSIMGLAKGYTVLAIVAPIIILGVPIFDMLFAIVRRLARGQSITTPDKDHLHHRLLRSGLNQRQSVLVLYIATSVLGIVAVVITNADLWKIILLGLAVIAFSIAGLINRTPVTERISESNEQKESDKQEQVEEKAKEQVKE